MSSISSIEDYYGNCRCKTKKSTKCRNRCNSKKTPRFLMLTNTTASWNKTDTTNIPVTLFEEVIELDNNDCGQLILIDAAIAAAITIFEPFASITTPPDIYNIYRLFVNGVQRAQAGTSSDDNVSSVILETSALTWTEIVPAGKNTVTIKLTAQLAGSATGWTALSDVKNNTPPFVGAKGAFLRILFPKSS